MKREEILVSKEELNVQMGFIQKIKSISPDNNKKYTITTLGCAMNENDSEKLSGMLSGMGFKQGDDESLSDVVVFNTCCVRENAELKMFGQLGALKNLKKENPEMIIAVCGCMMQQEDIVEQIKKKYRHVDIIFGTHNLYKFPEMIYSVLTDRRKVYDVWDTDGNIVEDLPIQRNDGIKASISIMFGCNNFCTYCIVPYVRGRERSRNSADILNEIRGLANQGYKEIMLLGQNVNSYGNDNEEGISFAKLLYMIEEIEGLERVRFLTSHPKDLSDELIDAMADCKKVSDHLHLPVQAGSTNVLRKMNRKYTKEEYLNLVDKLKAKIPNIALSTDIIVGFPGETEEDFLHTLDVVEKVRFDLAYTFLYSKRKGTPAEKMEDQVSEEAKKSRFNKLLDLQNRISKENNQKLQDQIVEILVEGPSRTDKDIMTGRTQGNKVVNFKASNSKPGDIIKVKITSAQTWSLDGIEI